VFGGYPIVARNLSPFGLACFTRWLRYRGSTYPGYVVAPAALPALKSRFVNNPREYFLACLLLDKSGWRDIIGEACKRWKLKQIRGGKRWGSSLEQTAFGV
jgi:hypothetical protein